MNVIDKETISQHTTCAIHRRNTNWGRDHKARHEKHHTNKTRSQLANAHHGDPNSFLDWIRIDLDDVFVKPHSLLIIHLVFPFCISLLAILSTLSHKHTPPTKQKYNLLFFLCLRSCSCFFFLSFFFLLVVLIGSSSRSLFMSVVVCSCSLPCASSLSQVFNSATTQWQQSVRTNRALLRR